MLAAVGSFMFILFFVIGIVFMAKGNQWLVLSTAEFDYLYDQAIKHKGLAEDWTKILQKLKDRTAKDRPIIKKVKCILNWYLSRKELIYLYQLAQEASGENTNDTAPWGNIAWKLHKTLRAKKRRQIDSKYEYGIDALDGDIYAPDPTWVVMQQWITIFQGAVITIALTIFFSYVAIVQFTYPDGIVGLIGNFMAMVCDQTGYCDFNSLLASFAVSQIMILFIVAFCFWSWHMINRDDKAISTLDDLANGLETINHQLTGIREQMAELETDLNFNNPEEE
ncbi:MAG: hypothetical protein EHM41_17305 [Chloroflexi bacterium]|nr:MAG: hypothetical protein EHM41_17305 [Chloroflexota bacterium]